MFNKNFLSKVSTVAVVSSVAVIIGFSGVLNNVTAATTTTSGYGYGTSGSVSGSQNTFTIKNNTAVSTWAEATKTTEPTKEATETTEPTKEATETTEPTKEAIKASDRIVKVNWNIVYSIDKKTCEVSKNIAESSILNFKTKFEDISTSKYQNDIKRLEKNDIVNGTTPTTFEPTKKISRAEFLAILLESHCYNVSMNPSSLPFSDVTDLNSWQARVIHSALNHGIISGDTKDGKKVFRPNDAISKVEAMAMVVGIRDIKVPSEAKHSYTDVAADWQNRVLNISQYLGLDKNKTKFMPNSKVDRDLMSKIIVDTVKLY